MNKNLQQVADTIKNAIRPIIIAGVEKRIQRFVEVRQEYRNRQSKDSDAFNARQMTMRDMSRRYNDNLKWVYAQVGKTTWFKYEHEQEDIIRQKLLKDGELWLLKIDYALVRKVTDEIVEITGKAIVGNDGYWEGEWKMKTVAGNVKIFGFRAIYAGGYNIQCLHIRTLYWYKEI